MTAHALNDVFALTKPGDFGIIGDPVEHSLSPDMQNAAFKMLWQKLHKPAQPAPTYHKFLLSAKELSEIPRLVKQFGLGGLNVTIPHKQAACDIVQELDPFAEKVDAVNTIVVSDGKLKGYNTDGEGFRLSLQHHLKFDVKDKVVMLLGYGGGTGRLILHALRDMKPKKIFVWNRTAQNKKDLSVDVLSNEEIEKFCLQADLIVNATSVGLSPGDGMPHKGLMFRKGQFVFDVIYHCETEFMRRAREAGATVMGGQGMLLYQGAASFKIWTQTEPPLAVMKEALTEAAQKKGIQLIWP